MAKKKMSPKRRRLLKRLLRVGVVIVVIMGMAFGAAKIAGPVRMSNTADGLRAFRQSVMYGSSDFPVALAQTPVTTAAMGSCPVSLSGNKIEVFNASGVRVLDQNHSYGEPAMRVRNGRALVFDRASGRFMLLSRTKVLWSGDAGRAIYAADVSKKGLVALATKSGIQSIVTVYKQNGGDEKFTWKCNSVHVADIAISPNGKSVAVAAIGVKNAELYTRIVVIDFGADKPRIDKTYADEVLCLEYLSNGTLLALGNSEQITLRSNGEETLTSFSGKELKGFASCETGMAVALEGSSLGNTQLLFFDKNGDKTADVNVPQEVTGLSVQNERITFLDGQDVFLYDKAGAQKAHGTFAFRPSVAYGAGKNFFAFTATELEQTSQQADK